MALIIQILLYILLFIILLLLLLLIVPICVIPEYKNGKFNAVLKIMFIPIKIFPFAEKANKDNKDNKKSKTKKEDKIKDAKNKDKKVDLKSKFPSYLEDIITIIQSSGKAIQIIFKGIFFNNIRIFYPVHKEDASKTAVYYGQLQATLNASFALLRNFLNLKFKNVKLIADFNNELKDSTYLSCRIYASLFTFLLAGIYVFKRLTEEKII